MERKELIDESEEAKEPLVESSKLLELSDEKDEVMMGSLSSAARK